MYIYLKPFFIELRSCIYSIRLDSNETISAQISDHGAFAASGPSPGRGGAPRARGWVTTSQSEAETGPWSPIRSRGRLSTGHRAISGRGWGGRGRALRPVAGLRPPGSGSRCRQSDSPLATHQPAFNPVHRGKTSSLSPVIEKLTPCAVQI